ncbi:MAG: fluoride efflux transporter CrcB [Candidatus Neomarinimicrobiota bacterium]
MAKIMIVGAGGFFGAIMRFAVSGLVNNVFTDSGFPWGTLVVNVLGCFIIGALTELMELRWGFSSEVHLLLIVGFLGSFTTFATFGHETLNLFNDQRIFHSFLNIGLQLFLGLSGIMLGRWVTVQVIK